MINLFLKKIKYKNYLNKQEEIRTIKLLFNLQIY